MDLNMLNSCFSNIKESDFFIKYTQRIKGFRLFENDNRLYFSNKEKGIDFIFIDDVLSSIHFYGKGHDEYGIYQGVLPFDFKISYNKNILYQKFGKFEIKKGGGEILPILGKSNIWSMFKFHECTLRVEFNEEDEIVLITLTKV